MFEELTTKWCENPRVSHMEINNTATRMNRINNVMGVITGKNKPAVVLELLNEGSECFLLVLSNVICFI